MKVAWGFAVAVALTAGCRDPRPDDLPDNGSLPPERSTETGLPTESIEGQFQIVRDPVSGLRVEPVRSRTYTYKGRRYYFESEENLRKFRENPELYLLEEKRTGEQKSGDPPPSDSPK